MLRLSSLADPTKRCAVLDVGAFFALAPELAGHVFAIEGKLIYCQSKYRDCGLDAIACRSYHFQLNVAAPADHERKLKTLVVSVPVKVVPLSRDLLIHSLSVEMTVVRFGTQSYSQYRKHALVSAELGLVKFLGDPNFSDCAFQLKGVDVPLHASRLLLSRSSPFFENMFSGAWAETQSNDPIAFATWDAPAVVLAVLHIYSGWLPTIPLPDETPEHVIKDSECNPATLTFSVWRNLFQLAQMLGFKQLALSVNRKLARMLSEEFDEMWAMPDADSNMEPPSKRQRMLSHGSSGSGAARSTPE